MSRRDRQGTERKRGGSSVGAKEPAADSFRVTRNYTEAYVARRGLFREETKRRMAHIAARKAKLAFDKRAEMEERTKQSSWRSSLGWGRSDETVLPIADEGSGHESPNCRLCAASFRVLVRKRYRCPLCELAVCGNCFNQRIQLDPVIFTDQPITEWICKACFALVQEEEERTSIAKAIDLAPKQPLVYYHGVVMEVVRTLSRHLPRYEAAVHAADSVSDCEEAGKLEVSLVELFKNFDIGVKKIASIKSDSEKELRVQASVKMALIGFLQDNLARFRTLQNQRKGLLLQFTEDEKAGRRAKQRRPTNENHETGPFIATIEPAMAPMAGTKLTFTGSNFKSGTRVEIAGILCRIKFMGADRLIVYSPALESEGLKNVVVTNPSGDSHKLENVLLYSDEYFRLAEADRLFQKAREDQKEKSPKKKNDARSTTTSSSSVPTRTMSSPVISGSTPLAIDDALDNSKVPLKEPVIRLIHPAICPVKGGTTLRLTGDHFCNQSKVRIGSKDAPVLKFSDATASSAGESQSQQLEVRSPGLGRVGFHAVEVINPGGKRYRLEEVLYYTDDPALLGESPSPPPSSSSPSSSSSTPRRVSGFFSRSSLGSSTSVAKESGRGGGTIRKAESTDNFEGKDKLAAPPPTRATVLRTASDNVGSPAYGGRRKDDTNGFSSPSRSRFEPNVGNNDDDNDGYYDDGVPSWASKSTSILSTKSTSQQKSPLPALSSFGALTVGDFITDDNGDDESSRRSHGSGSRGGAGRAVSGGRLHGAGSGHARSVSLDQGAFARGGGAALIRDSATDSAPRGGGGAVDLGSGGYFWNVIDSESSTSSAPSSPSLSSSSSSATVPASRLRWGASNRN